MADEERGQEPARIMRLEAGLLRVPVFALAVRGSATLDGFDHPVPLPAGDPELETVQRGRSPHRQREDRDAQQPRFQTHDPGRFLPPFLVRHWHASSREKITERNRKNTDNLYLSTSRS